MQLLPSAPLAQVRVLAADDTGCLISFQMAKWVPAVSWRYSVADSSRIEAVCIGDVDAKGKYTVRITVSQEEQRGARWHRGRRLPQVWYAVGTTVRSLDKLGKEAAAFSTNSTETVRLLCVGGGYAWTAGEYVVNLFDTTGKDLGYVMCPDRVQALATGAFIREGGVDAVVGCADRVIRVVSVRPCHRRAVTSCAMFIASAARMVQGSRVMSEVGVEGPVTALCVQPHPGSATGPAPSSAGPLVWYGTANGAVGVLAVRRKRRVRPLVPRSRRAVTARPRPSPPAAVCAGDAGACLELCGCTDRRGSGASSEVCARRVGRRRDGARWERGDRVGWPRLICWCHLHLSG